MPNPNSWLLQCAKTHPETITCTLSQQSSLQYLVMRVPRADQHTVSRCETSEVWVIRVFISIHCLLYPIPFINDGL